MLTLYHAPQSRSSRIVWLNEELGNPADVEVVDIRRARTNSGARDPRNPHPEGKVPLLVHDGVEIWETTAIALYLTDLVPEAGLGVPQGDPLRGRYLSWLAWYSGVMEPVLIAALCDLSHPMFHASLRGLPEVAARLETALADGPWVMGKQFTAADIILQSAYRWAPHMTPDSPAIRDWLQRCADRPAARHTVDYDASLMAAA